MKKIVVVSLLFSCFVICSMDKKEDRKKDSLSSPQGSKKRNKSSSDTSAPVRKVDSLDQLQDEIRKKMGDQKTPIVKISSTEKK